MPKIFQNRLNKPCIPLKPIRTLAEMDQERQFPLYFGQTEWVVIEVLTNTDMCLQKAPRTKLNFNQNTRMYLIYLICSGLDVATAYYQLYK